MSRGAALLDWYRANSRDLPWRRSTDPWAILVSEVMLQQTQVSRVIPRFESFLARFPDPPSAAAAPLGDILEMWVGLGYNSRARRLHQAAQIIARDGWPRDVESLRRLPGVGEYTSAAVASIAFGSADVAVDTNVRRVVARWTGRPLSDREVAKYSRESMTGDAGRWNQAVMELGATICRPEPECDRCPVAADCDGADVYIRPRGQTRFEGSVRQARGAIVKILVATGATSREQVRRQAALEGERFDQALDALLAEGMVAVDGDHIAISGTPIR